MRHGQCPPAHQSLRYFEVPNGYVAMGISSDAQWTKFCQAFHVPEWDIDERYCSNLVRGYHYFGDLRVKLAYLLNYTMQEIAAVCDEALIPGTCAARPGSAGGAAASGARHDCLPCRMLILDRWRCRASRSNLPV